MIQAFRRHNLKQNSQHFEKWFPKQQGLQDPVWLYNLFLFWM